MGMPTPYNSAAIAPTDFLSACVGPSHSTDVSLFITRWPSTLTHLRVARNVRWMMKRIPFSLNNGESTGEQGQACDRRTECHYRNTSRDVRTANT